MSAQGASLRGDVRSGDHHDSSSDDDDSDKHTQSGKVRVQGYDAEVTAPLAPYDPSSTRGRDSVSRFEGYIEVISDSLFQKKRTTYYAVLVRRQDERAKRLREVERSRERERERGREVAREEKKTQGGCVGQSVPQTCHVDEVAWDLRA